MAKTTYTCDFCGYQHCNHSTFCSHLFHDHDIRYDQTHLYTDIMRQRQYRRIVDEPNSMFLDNDYTKQYYQIIRAARQKTYIKYTEKHHIIPRSLGGSDSMDNLIIVSAKEHFMCHYLLVHMFKKDTKEYFKTLRAFSSMRQGASNNRVIDADLYAELKEEISRMFSISQTGKGNSQYGKISIRNYALRKVIRVKKNEISEYLENGWVLGGIIKWEDYDPTTNKTIKPRKKYKRIRKPKKAKHLSVKKKHIKEWKPSKNITDALDKILGIQYSCKDDIEKLKTSIQNMLDLNSTPNEIKKKYNLNVANATDFFKNTLNLKTQTINDYYTGMRSDKEQYLYDCRYKFKDDSRVPKYGTFNDNDVISKLHLVPMEFGWANNIDSSIISHPANCMIISRSLFLKSNTKYHISLEQLMSRIDAWDNNQPIPQIYFEKVVIPKSEEHRKSIAKARLGTKKKTA